MDHLGIDYRSRRQHDEMFRLMGWLQAKIPKLCTLEINPLDTNFIIKFPIKPDVPFDNISVAVMNDRGYDKHLHYETYLRLGDKGVRIYDSYDVYAMWLNIDDLSHELTRLIEIHETGGELHVYTDKEVFGYDSEDDDDGAVDRDDDY